MTRLPLILLLLALPLSAACWWLASDSPHVISSLMPSPEPTAPAAPAHWQEMPGSERLANLVERRTSDASHKMGAQGFRLGDPVFLRILKESSELELWLKPQSSETFQLYHTYPIACWSGTLGPKLKEGDRQAPEGFYNVSAGQMNPQSLYHLAFNIGYPNAFDLANQRTGSLIMVHGKTSRLAAMP